MSERESLGVGSGFSCKSNTIFTENCKKFAHNVEQLSSTMEVNSVSGFGGNANCENALILNKEVQCRLIVMRQRLEGMLRNVREVYAANESLLNSGMKRHEKGIGMRGAYLKGGTFYLKGNMFFKDLDCRNCPNNADYERRRDKENEMFPMDLELRGRHVWSMLDKLGIVQGIKEQVIDYLNDAKKHQIVRDGSDSRNDGDGKEKPIRSEKLADLLTRVGDDFVVDWTQISSHNLRHRHSPSSCEAMWNVYLNTNIKRTAWTTEENKTLLNAAKTYNFQNWTAIAKLVGRRSDYQCFVQYQNSVCYMLPQRWSRWNRRDDQRLLELVEKHSANGVINWNNVAAHFPHKPKTSIQGRYAYSLNPQISHAPFTPEEDLLLLAAVKEYGTKFSCFPRTLFPNRTVIQLRCRYQNTIIHRHKLKPWTVEDDKKLMSFVAEHGTSAWLNCSKFLGSHSRTSCRTRYLTIQKFLKKNPNAGIEDLPRKKQCTPGNTITSENWPEKIAELRENPNVNFKPQKCKLRATRERKKSHVKRKDKEVLRKRKLSSKSKLSNGIAEDSSKTTTTTTTTTKHSARFRKKILYVQRLRAIGIKLYDFFKYSYNFTLGDNPTHHNLFSTYTLSIVADVLDFRHMLAENLHKEDNNNPASITALNQSRCGLQPQVDGQLITAGMQLPPSWSTTMAFRALCIQSSQSNYSSHTPISHRESLQRFRQRFHALFYKTALLSRLHPSVVGIEEKRASSESIVSGLRPLRNYKSQHTRKAQVDEYNIESQQYRRLCIDSCETDIKPEIEM